MKFLSRSKQAAQKYDERFNLRKLIELEVREQYQLNIHVSVHHYIIYENDQQDATV